MYIYITLLARSEEYVFSGVYVTLTYVCVNETNIVVCMFCASIS